ncbi:iron-sulfur cluster assembly scaffold protein [Desulfosporosinus sp. PR]|uniref:iron-sulfur cluster assembly scaffold protein n=1 Tax=Candidatus Desulfosporosinus nitrosoreducens TaxID=3401928 RepID=UPI0027FFB38F|nr:iron-sulfur cluster assembly scaffold protein [Desulfosporosinus sp. PR]MDQ7095360.1 iron-sulfur cluster assembly scaffold protein [Desulfosporosinus sp. PR]
MYSEKVMKHFLSPQNAYRMLDADAEGSLGDPSCGDSLTMFIKVRDNYIEKISYLAFGCCALIAVSSMTTVLAMGEHLNDALRITEEDVIRALDGLSPMKQHCSNLGVGALRKAINNYYEAKRQTEILIKEVSR